MVFQNKRLCRAAVPSNTYIGCIYLLINLAAYLKKKKLYIKSLFTHLIVWKIPT